MTSTTTKTPVVTKTASPRLAEWLREQDLSLALTSYQSGHLYMVGSVNDNLSYSERAFERAMGIARDGDGFYLGAAYQVWRFENIVGPGEIMHDKFDKYYVPRVAHTTGAIDIHEVVVVDDRPVFVNTKYSCLATTSKTHSFKPVWRPPFITEIAAGDRCHLNGVATVDGELAYVTMAGMTDTPRGWRFNKALGGVVIDVRTNEVVCEGLSMPHSPRWADGKLWVLDSGRGYLGWVDFATKQLVPVAFIPGFLRGLDIHGDYAIVGSSKPRDGRFQGMELDEHLQELQLSPFCGLQIVQLSTGVVQHWIQLEGDLTEVFDVAFFPGVRNPGLVGLRTSEVRDLLTIDLS